MTANTIYIAIFLATCATYLCRAMGVFSAKNINTNSPVFNWIKCCLLYTSDAADE